MNKINVNVEDFDLSETPVICDVEIKTEVLELAQPLSELEDFEYPSVIKQLVTFKPKNFENLRDITVEVVIKASKTSDTSCNYDFPRVAKAEFVDLTLIDFINDMKMQEAINTEYADFSNFIIEAIKYAITNIQHTASFNFDSTVVKAPCEYKDRQVTIEYPSYQY